MLEASKPILQGEYKLQRLLDDQGCTRVYLATRIQESHKQYAIKEVDLQYRNLDDKISQLKRFQDVVADYMHLTHPNVVRLCDFFPENGHEYLVFDFVPGYQIAEILKMRHRPLTQDQVLEAAVDICKALMYLHACQPARFMGDFAPSNIIVTHDATFKLTNYGLGKVLVARDGGSPWRGTLGYAPPEQSGPQAVVNERTEVYGLAALMFHMLTLQHPAAFEGILPPVRHLNPHVSAELEDFLTLALDRDPIHRIPDIVAAWSILKPLAVKEEVELPGKPRGGVVSQLFDMVFSPFISGKS